MKSAFNYGVIPALFVIPAKAGIRQAGNEDRMPAFAGMTM
jgi:hypothetical protein